MPSPERLRIAVVGTGISGLSAAWLLHQRHDVTVYEKAGRIGGHSNTVSVRLDGVESRRRHRLHRLQPATTYPNFVELLQVLGVESCDTDMSFAASLDGGRIEYSGSSLAGLFSQRSNLLRPRFWGMLADLVRFYSHATRDAQLPMAEDTTLGQYLAAGRYGAAFRDHHILPMASAIWSAAPAEILELSSRRLPALLRQSRTPARDRAADLAHRRRRQPRLCRAPRRAARRRSAPSGPGRPASSEAMGGSTVVDANGERDSSIT